MNDDLNKDPIKAQQGTAPVPQDWNLSDEKPLEAATSTPGVSTVPFNLDRLQQVASAAPVPREWNLSAEKVSEAATSTPGISAVPFNLDRQQQAATAAPVTRDWNLSSEKVSAANTLAPGTAAVPFNLDQDREETRGDLARGLLWLLTFAIGGVLVFIGLGRLEGSVLTQSIFPSLIALAGTALGFYFGSQTKTSDTASTGQSGTGPTKTGQ